MVNILMMVAYLMTAAKFNYKKLIYTIDCKDVVDDKDYYKLDGRGGMYLDTINTYHKTVCDTLLNSGDGTGYVATVAINNENVSIDINGGKFKLNAKIKRKYHLGNGDGDLGRITTDHGYSLNWSQLNQDSYIYRIYSTDNHYGTIVRTKYGMLIETNTDSKFTSNYKIMLFDDFPKIDGNQVNGKTIETGTEKFQYFVMDFDAEYCEEIWERLSH